MYKDLKKDNNGNIFQIEKHEIFGLWDSDGNPVGEKDIESFEKTRVLFDSKKDVVIPD